MLPMCWWKALSKTSTKLRFQGEHAVDAGTLEGFSMNAKYGLDGTNEAWIRTNMCSGSSNCFVFAPGFSTQDKDQDNYGPQCAQSYGKVGWWYANCFTYNAHYHASKSHFTSYIKHDKTSNCWAWWVR
jgi:hypothetical protein